MCCSCWRFQATVSVDNWKCLQDGRLHDGSNFSPKLPLALAKWQLVELPTQFSTVCWRKNSLGTFWLFFKAARTVTIQRVTAGAALAGRHSKRSNALPWCHAGHPPWSNLWPYQTISRSLLSAGLTGCLLCCSFVISYLGAENHLMLALPKSRNLVFGAKSLFWLVGIPRLSTANSGGSWLGWAAQKLIQSAHSALLKGLFHALVSLKCSTALAWTQQSPSEHF